MFQWTIYCERINVNEKLKKEKKKGNLYIAYVVITKMYYNG